MNMVDPGLIEFINENAKEAVNKKPWMQNRTFKCCESISELQEYIDQAIQQPFCAFDTETTGLNTRMKNGKPTSTLVGCSFSYDSRFGLYVPVGHIESPEKNLPIQPVLDEIRRLCNSTIIICHNAKYDLSIIRNYGIIVTDHERIEDTQILTRLHDAGRKETGLKDASKDYLDQEMIEFSEICGSAKRLDYVDPTLATVYAASDAVCTLDLFNFYMKRSIVTDQRPIYNLEKRTIFVVMNMESNLFKIDVPYLESLRDMASKKLEELQRDIYRLVNKEFNIGSSQQLGKLLFEELKYRYPDKGKMTSTGKWSTDTATLEKMKGEYPVVEKIIKYRELDKSLGTYITNLLANHDEDGCIKLGFNQSGTDTGRFSSPGGRGIDEDGYCGVNVQSLPSNYSEDAPDIRKSFIARPGYKIVAMDYSGEELRVATNLSREPIWVDAFFNDADLHKKTGQIIYGREEISKAERQAGKCVARGTLIASNRGWLPIEKLLASDKVLTYSGEYHPITIWDMGIKPGITLTGRIVSPNDGDPDIAGNIYSITCGLNHRFMTTEDSWVRAEDLLIGQLVKIGSSGDISEGGDVKVVTGYVAIQSKTAIDSVALMDLTVENDHTYVAQGFITHNTMNFSILYGAGPRRISEATGSSEAEASRMLQSFFAGLPVLKKWIDGVIKQSRRTKIVKTAFGRARPLHVYYDSGDKGMMAHGDRCVPNTHVQGCLQAHERCLTSKGYIPIKEILQRKDAGEEFKVWTGTSWETFDVLDRGPAKLATIELDNGMQLDTDTRHEVLVVGKKGYEFRKYANLKKGDAVCLSMPTLKEYGKYPKEFRASGNVWNAQTVIINTPEQWDFIGYMLGYLTGDGHTYENVDQSKYVVSFAFGRKKVQKNFEFLKKGFTSLGVNISEPSRSKGSRGESYRSSVCSIAIIELLHFMLYKFETARGKRVPQKIFEAPLSMRKAFLKGYYDTDGGNLANRGSFHTPNKKLLQDVQLLAWSMGCPSLIHEDKTGAFLLSWMDTWRFAQLVGLEIPERKRRSNSNLLPLPEFHRAEVIKALPDIRYKDSPKNYAYLYKIKDGQPVNALGVLDLMTDYEVSLPQVYATSKLKSKTALNRTEHTYTLSVHNPLHRFDSAGIISKNTSADIMKMAMVRVYSWIQLNGYQNDVRMLLTMHDEIVFEIKADKLDFFIPRLNKIMLLEDILQGILKWPVKLKVDAEYGDSWHVDHNYFEEHPEMLKNDPEVSFSNEQQAPKAAAETAVSAQVIETPETPLQNTIDIPEVTIPEVPVSDAPVSAVSQENVVPQTQDMPSEVSLTSTPVDDVNNLTVETKPAEITTNEEFVYTLRNTSKSTARIFNIVIGFCEEERDSKIKYSGPLHRLVLKDSQGNSLLVESPLVYKDGFIFLARFFGI